MNKKRMKELNYEQTAVTISYTNYFKKCVHCIVHFTNHM